MSAPKRTDFRHREAYCLMRYASDDGQVVEWIWNSRDGVTPFIVKSRCGKEMRHVHWAYDLRVPDYPPLPGERIFVDATEELLRPRAEEIISRQHPELGGHARDVMVNNTIRAWMIQPGTPLCVEVGGTHANESPLGKAIAAARAEAAKKE